jgi:Lsr2
MAKTTVVTLTDDLDGTKADRTVSFGLSGTTYEIDLSKKNATALEKSLTPYLEAARKASRGGPTARRRPNAPVKHGLSAVRAWAKENGFEVSDRGRISSTVVDAYNASK